MQDPPKIQSPNMCRLMGKFDRFWHHDSQFGLIGRILRDLDKFGLIHEFRISAEELSQLFCRIHRKFKVVVFADEWVNPISFGIMILNLD